MAWAYDTSDQAVNVGPQITAVAIIFTTLSLLVFSLRLYVRGWMIKAIGAGTYGDMSATFDLRLTGRAG